MYSICGEAERLEESVREVPRSHIPIRTTYILISHSATRYKRRHLTAQEVPTRTRSSERYIRGMGSLQCARFLPFPLFTLFDIVVNTKYFAIVYLVVFGYDVLIIHIIFLPAKSINHSRVRIPSSSWPSQARASGFESSAGSYWLTCRFMESPHNK